MKTQARMKAMKNRTLVISVILVCVTVALALSVATYAIWQEQATDYEEIQIPTDDFNPSAKYIIYQGLDANGNFIDESPLSYAVVGYSGIISELIIPDTYNGLPVTRISCSTTQTNTNLAGNNIITSLVVPASVTKIDQGIFANAVKLKTVTILGEGDIIIEPFAFAGCVELTTFTTQKNITGDEASYLLNTPLGN